jgi:cation diffusion facilitator family transporter
MSTHAGALLLSALAYTYARRHTNDPRFTFGTGKLGDLAGFTSAIILTMIAILIGYEAATRFFNPVPVHFREAIPIAFLGLAVNVASAWLLSGAEHHDHDQTDSSEQSVAFEEHEHAHEKAHRDNNLRAAVLHVIADATVSVCVILALILAWAFAWEWMDPAAGIVGALVIGSWSYALTRDTGAILLDMNPDHKMAGNLRKAVEQDGDQLADLHLWRLGPGHLGAILLIGTDKNRGPDYYRARLARFRSLSHLTIEVRPI